MLFVAWPLALHGKQWRLTVNAGNNIQSTGIERLWSKLICVRFMFVSQHPPLHASQGHAELFDLVSQLGNWTLRERWENVESSRKGSTVIGYRRGVEKFPPFSISFSWRNTLFCSLGTSLDCACQECTIKHYPCHLNKMHEEMRYSAQQQPKNTMSVKSKYKRMSITKDNEVTSNNNASSSVYSCCLKLQTSVLHACILNIYVLYGMKILQTKG